MSQAAFNVFDALSAWGKTLSNWQRCLLVKLVGAVDFPDEALDEVYREYLMDQQLATAEMPRATWDIALPQIQGGPTTASSVVTAMTALTGVNALAPGETLTFGRKLTVIYGPNGAGKSGYARVLKAACFTRSKQTAILGDVKLAKHKQPTPSATFAFDDGSSTTFVYKEPCQRLRDNFAVFDSTCVRVHLDERNAFQVMPYLFDVFPRMVEVFGKLQRKLRDDIAPRSHATDKFAIPGSTSEVATLLATLTAQTNLVSLKALAVFGDEERARLESVVQQLATLRTTDPKEIIRQNEQRITDLDALKVSLSGLHAAVSPALAEQIINAVKQIQTLTEKAAALSAAQLGEEPVQPIGTAAWRDLLAAAIAYNAEAYPDEAFPPKADAARCVLCHQVLDEDGVARLTRFYQFATSDVEAQLGQAKTTLAGYGTKLSKISLAFFDEGSVARRTLTEVDAAMVAAASSHVEGYREVIGALARAVSGAFDPGLSMLDHDPVSARITELVKRLKSDNDALRQKDPKVLMESLMTEEQFLLDRQVLSGQYDAIAAAVADLKWVVKANACIRGFAVTQREVTGKQKALATELVAQGFITRFTDNCAALQLKLPVQFRFAGDAGTTDRKIEIANASVAGIDPSSVLSEGEQTAAALADFLTEVELNGSCLGVVFDDPVTSMDHVRKEAIAQRLVDEAAKRQVIVFTHDILFTNYLATAAVDKGVDFAGRTVWRGEAEEPGVIDSLAFPHEHYEGAAHDRARKHLDVARTLDGDKQRDSLEKACGSLRTAYEDFIQRKLFGNVVRRWRENITFTLSQVYFDEGIAAQVHMRMVMLSRYIDAHSHSPDFHEVPLTIDFVVDELAQMDRIKAEYSTARKAWEKAKPQAATFS